MAVFRILISKVFYAFSGFVKEVTPCSRAKTVIPRDFLYGILVHDKPSLLETVLWVVMAVKQTMKS